MSEVTFVWLAMVAPCLAAVIAIERHIRASLWEPERKRSCIKPKEITLSGL